MRRLIQLLGVLGIAAGAVAWWRRHPRSGAAWVNRVVDPWLVNRGVVTASKGNVVLLEHVGRKSGLHRMTPVHPVETADGFRIIAPLGTESQWARNVLAAGGCRLYVGDVVHELADPVLVTASSIDGVPRVAAAAMDWLGFRYLVVKRAEVRAEPVEPLPATAPEPAPISEGVAPRSRPRPARRHRRSPEAQPVA